MRQLKIALAIAVVAALQSSLRGVWPSFGFIDLPLILAVYYALRREMVTALVAASVAGVAADALGSGGLLGAGGFAKTVTAYLVVMLAVRVMVDHPLARIPVLAGATAVSTMIYIGLHQALGQQIQAAQPLVVWVAWHLLATTIAGSFIMLIIDNFFSERARQRRQFAIRRRGLRR